LRTMWRFLNIFQGYSQASSPSMWSKNSCTNNSATLALRMDAYLT
jgi:hypothetical protein